MSKELVISANRHETRVAIIEDDQVVEVYHQRENEYSLAGSIHKGRVTRVLPGMQSAFVDLGLDRDACLYGSDFFEDNEEYDKIVTSVEEKVLKLDRPLPVPMAALPPVAGPPAEVQEPVEMRGGKSEAERLSRWWTAPVQQGPQRHFRRPSKNSVAMTGSATDGDRGGAGGRRAAADAACRIPSTIRRERGARRKASQPQDPTRRSRQFRVRPRPRW